MKELSIEEKAKAYDNIIEKANKMHGENCEACQICIEELIPELKESEDEKIRKKIIQLVNDAMATNAPYKKEMLAWLEKQSTPQVRTGLEWVNTIDDACDKRYSEEYAHGEYCHEQSFKWGFQEGVDWLEKQDEQKPADKVEPKFHEGDWAIDKESKEVFYISKNLANTYEIVDIEGNDYHVPHYTLEEDYDVWTIADAKEGDVLCYKTKDELRIFIYIGYGHTHYHCCYYNEHLTTVDSFFVIQKHLESYIHPATKEQRDLLFQKMKEAGYEWDAEKKELKKIDQKSAWSEEDERMCQETIDWFEKKCFPYALESENPAIESINWLKSLKERCAWKPSEEQITCLHDAVARYNQEGFSAATLTSLLEQLKKLREE